jgi:cytochrome P450
MDATFGDLAPQPPHVPDSAVFDFDIYRDPGFVADPHKRLGELLTQAPEVFWTPRNHGHWVVLGFDANFEAGRDWRRFSSALPPPEVSERVLAMLPPGAPHVPTARPINQDPPDHTTHRAALLGAFSPKAVNGLKIEIRALAASLIDQAVREPGCDFIAAVAEPLPVKVFLKLMGLPIDRLAEFRILVHEMLAPNPGGDFLEHVRRMRKVADAMLDVIVARKHEPKDDLISQLWRSEVDGRPVTYELIEDFCILLFAAGLDTVINAIGFGVRHLAQDLALQAELRARPELIGEAVEELLRRYGIVITQRRMLEDAELAGRSLRAGDLVFLAWPAAGLDARRFPDPERVDLERKDKVHLVFASGPHRCLGSHLARVELQILYEELLARAPPFRLDPAAPVRFRTGNIIAVEALPLVWDRAQLASP